MSKNTFNLRKRTEKKYILIDSSDSDKENLPDFQLKGNAQLIQKRRSKKRADSDSDSDSGSDFEFEKTKAVKKRPKYVSKNADNLLSDPDDNDYDTNDPLSDSNEIPIDAKLNKEHYEQILYLFNNATQDQFLSITQLEQERLELLFTLRPFKNYEQLRNTLVNNLYFTTLEAVEKMIYARYVVTNLFERCTKISEKMEQKVASLIKNNSSQELELKFQPKSLNNKMTLKPYQLIGLNWLCLLHKEKINGILADEMGLGKTCQTIAFLTHLKELNPNTMNLIVVPSSTLDNWIREITMWSPDFNFTVYQGSPKERRFLRKLILNKSFTKPLNAILTTYNQTLISNEDRIFYKKLIFDYCVFDEAHMLKNMQSLRYQGLDGLNSKRRLLLTGTPIQNNLLELMSLLYFVMPEMFQGKKQYVNKIFANKRRNIEIDPFYAQKVEQAKGIMNPFILRRVKTEVLKNLPVKTQELVYCDMTDRQKKEYIKLRIFLKEQQEKNLQLQIEKAKSLEKAVGVLKKLSSDLVVDNENKQTVGTKCMFNVLMELRKAANHPLLRRCLYDDEKLKQMANLIMKESTPDTVYDFVLEDLTQMNDFELHSLCSDYKGLEGFELKNEHILDSGKFFVLDKLLREKKQNGDRCLLFSQFKIMLDIIEDFLKIKKYKFIRLDGSTEVKDRQGLIDKFNESDEIFIFLLTTKAGGVGINLTAANNVILYDIDYNPFNDKQAEDRSHRIGQTKDVKVYTLLSKDSVDDTMLKIQKYKLELDVDINDYNKDSKNKTKMAELFQEALKL